MLPLLLVLLACLPPLVIDLDGRNPKHWMEGASLATSAETWMRQEGGEAGAWLRPTLNGGLRLNKPPMLVWLNLLAWTGLEPESATPEQLMQRARLVTAGLGLVLVASIYWMGRTLGGARLGVLAALIAGTMTFFFQMQARMASYDMHMVAWAALASAGALHALQPFNERPSRGRAAVGWIVCGLGMGLSVLSKNPLGMVICGLLIASVMATDFRHILGRLGGLLAGLGITLAVVAPWYVYHLLRDAETVLAIWSNEYSGRDSSRHGPFFYVILLRLALPWTLWVIAGLFQPFLRAHGLERRRRLIAWLWFCLILIVFSTHTGKATRYILPILPAMSLLAAQVFADHQALADKGAKDRGAALLYLPHWLAVIVVSAAFAPFLAAQRWLAAGGWLDGPGMAPIGPGTAALATAVLLGLAVTGFLRHRRNHPMRAGVLCACWMLLVSVLYWHSYAHTAGEADRYRAEAERIARVVGEAPLRYVGDSLAQHPDLEFLFFLRRIVPMVPPERLEHYAESVAGAAYIMADRGDRWDELLRQGGFHVVCDFADEAGHQRRLWGRRTD